MNVFCQTVLPGNRRVMFATATSDHGVAGGGIQSNLARVHAYHLPSAKKLACQKDVAYSGHLAWGRTWTASGPVDGRTLRWKTNFFDYCIDSAPTVGGWDTPTDFDA
eukprot:INCI9707.2.p4 GENE.INCI9707.2~~INCI9707.2.p4  ORF type:complete len:107 (+),score=14.37 INCI9707.2:136-456(+)